jgi:outer membrane murein-binding lipoprotein Lpp
MKKPKFIILLSIFILSIFVVGCTQNKFDDASNINELKSQEDQLNQEKAQLSDEIEQIPQEVKIKPASPSPPHFATCEGLDNLDRGNCMRELFSDLSFCKTLDSYWKNDCYSQTAKNLNDSTICENIDDSYEGADTNNCYFAVAVKLALLNSDPAHCDNVKSQGDKDQCLWSLFILTKNPEICNLLIDEIYKKECNNVIK